MMLIFILKEFKNYNSFEAVFQIGSIPYEYLLYQIDIHNYHSFLLYYLYLYSSYHSNYQINLIKLMQNHYIKNHNKMQKNPSVISNNVMEIKILMDVNFLYLKYIHIITLL